jgi:hypothetical protein
LEEGEKDGRLFIGRKAIRMRLQENWLRILLSG